MTDQNTENPQEAETLEPTQKSSRKFKLPKINIFNKKILIPLIIVLTLAGLYFLRGAFIAALVNGKPISRFSVINSLERSQGKQALENLIVESLVEQQAAKEGIVVGQEEINGEITKIEQNLASQGTTLEEALELSGITRAELERQVTLQLKLNNILSDRANVTDEEINNYIEANKEFLPEGVTEEEVKTQVRDSLQKQKLDSAYQQWVEEAKNEANILYFVRY